MKINVVVLVLALFTLISKNILAQAVIKADGKALVEKVYETLAKLKNIRYDHKRVVDIKSESVYSEFGGKMTIIFDSKSPIGIQYLFDFPKEGRSSYNGEDYFYSSTDGSKKELKFFISENELNNQSVLGPSINTLKTNFKKIKDSNEFAITTADTTVADKKYINIYLQLKGFDFAPNGGALQKLSDEITFYYIILVDPNTFLPYQINRKYSLNNEDIIKTTFSNLEINCKDIDYKWLNMSHVKIEKKVPVVKPLNTLNKNWTLPILGENKTISKNDLNGKVIMLEFFSIACSPCREEIPWLVDYTNKMGGKAFQLFSVDGPDNFTQLNKYKENYKNINYNILFNAKSLEKYYNINGYPSVVLINKKGEVIYNGDLDKEKIEKLVGENL